MSRLLIATLLFATAADCAEAPQPLPARVVQHDKQWKSGNFKDAEIGYKALLAECAGRKCHEAVFGLLNNNYGAMLVSQGRYAESRPMLMDAVKAFAACGVSRDADRATALLNYGEASRALAENAAAEKALLESVALRARVHGEHSREVAAVHISLSSLYRDLGRLQEAAGITGKALGLYESGKVPEDLLQATLLDLRGLALRHNRDFTRAEEAYGKALQIRRRHAANQPALLASSYNNLGAVRMDQGQYQEARAQLEQALALRVSAQGPEHPLLVSVYSNLALCLQEIGDLPEAERYAGKALAIATAKLGHNHSLTGSALNNLGQIYLLMGRVQEADPLLRAAIERLEAVAPNSPVLAICLANLAHLFIQQEKHSGAEKLLVRALKICERVHSPEHPAYLRLGRALAQVYRLQNRNTEADRFERNAFRFR